MQEAAFPGWVFVYNTRHSQKSRGTGRMQVGELKLVAICLCVVAPEMHAQRQDTGRPNCQIGLECLDEQGVAKVG